MSGDATPVLDYRALDDVIHARIRLMVMALLAGVDDAEFTLLRDRVGTTDGNLGAHLARLTEAGYVRTSREVVGPRAVSRFALTARGRAAFHAYVDRMEAILNPDAP